MKREKKQLRIPSIRSNDLGKSEYIISTKWVFKHVREKFLGCDSFADFDLKNLTDSIQQCNHIQKSFSNVELSIKFSNWKSQNSIFKAPHVVRIPMGKSEEELADILSNMNLNKNVDEDIAGNLPGGEEKEEEKAKSEEDKKD